MVMIFIGYNSAMKVHFQYNSNKAKIKKYLCLAEAHYHRACYTKYTRSLDLLSIHHVHPKRRQSL